MSIKIHVACPVCHKSLTYDHAEADAWGSLSLWSYGIVEITAHDKGVLAEHMNSHSLEDLAAARKLHAAAHTVAAEKTAGAH